MRSASFSVMTQAEIPAALLVVSLVGIGLKALRRPASMWSASQAGKVVGESY